MKSRRGALSALCIAGVLVIAACGSDDESSSGDTAAGGTTAPGATTAGHHRCRRHHRRRRTTPAAGGDSLLNGTIKCEQQYAGKEVHIFSPVRDTETDKGARVCVTAMQPLEECTGLKVVYDGTDQFETEVIVRVDGGNPPDVIDFPQPGGFLDLIKKGQRLPLPRRRRAQP